MQFSVASAAFVVLMALVSPSASAPSAVAEDIELLVANTIIQCAQQHSISAADVLRLRLTVDKSTVHPTRPLKCFTKCGLELSGVIHDGAVDVERAVAVGVAEGHDATKVRNAAEHCKKRYAAEKSGCSDMWKMYVCFHTKP